jgi:hypothetical protein
MKVPSPFFGFKAKAIALTAAAIVIIHLTVNVTITNAQQPQEQQQLSTSQPTTSTVTQNGTTATTRLFESTKDNFRVQPPEGWVIQDVNNTGFALAAEVTEGYGLLAELCPEEEGQQQGALTNVSSSICQQQAQEKIIHIIRYPNLGARLAIAIGDVSDNIPDSILEYEMQKLQDVGYRDINIVNSTDTTINIHYITTENVLLRGEAEDRDVPAPEAFIPARLVEMTYSTNSAPSEMRRGYFFLAATSVTSPNLETITGYSIFYEDTSGATAVEQTTTPTGNLLLPAPFRQVFDSFEPIASEEAVQVILAAIGQQAVSNEPNDQVEEDETGEDETGEEDEDNDEE